MKLGATGKNGADRSAEPLGEIQPERIEGAGECSRLDAAFDHGIHQPRPVHMHGEAVASRDIADRPNGLQRPDRPAAPIAGLLDRDQPGTRLVARARADRPFDLGGAELAALAIERIEHRQSECCGTASLGDDAMGGAIEDDLVARPAVHPIGDLVAHGARWQIDRFFLAEKVCDPLAELVHGWIEIRLLVADLGLRHEAAHAGARLGSGITVEIDHAGTFAVFSDLAFADAV